MTKKEYSKLFSVWVDLNMALGVINSPYKEFPKGKRRLIDRKVREAYTTCSVLIQEYDEKEKPDKKINEIYFNPPFKLSNEDFQKLIDEHNAPYDPIRRCGECKKLFYRSKMDIRKGQTMPNLAVDLLCEKCWNEN